MILVAPDETYIGMNMMIRSLGGEKITFTRFKIGNGTVNAGDDVKALTNLVNPLIEFGITSKECPNDNTVVIKGNFNTNIVTEDFRCREIGLFCKGEDEEEVLYAYAYSGDEAGMLKKNTTGVSSTQSFAFSITVSNSANITAVLTESTIYITKEEFENHVNGQNPHKLAADDVGLGNVPDVSTNDQTPTYSLAKENSELESGEKLSVAFGKIAKVISSFIAHVKEKNPHKTTLTDLGGAAKEHSHSVNDIISGILGIARGGTGVSSYAALSQKLITCGNYTGDGAISRTIALGFAPGAVLVFDCYGRTTYYQDGVLISRGGLSVSGYTSINLNASQGAQTVTGWNASSGVVQCVSNGFRVNENETNHIHSNSDGELYYYIAIK